MSKLILNVRYIKPKDSAKDLIRYIATREGVELNLSDEKLSLPATDKQKRLIEKLRSEFPEVNSYHEYNDYVKDPTIENASELISAATEYNMHEMADGSVLVKYMSERPGAERVGNHGLFSRGSEPIFLDSIMNEIENHSGNIWTNVISLRREDAERLSFNNQSEWKNLITSRINDLSKNMRIPLENLKWYGAFHNESHHPHVHLIVYSDDPSKGYLTESGIENLRSAFANKIFEDELYEIYKQKTIIRDDLRKYSSEYMTDIVRQINDSNFDNPKLLSLMTELSEKLKDCKGKKVYGYLPKNVKDMVGDITKEIAQDEKINELYKGWCAVQNQVCGYYKLNIPDPLPLWEQKEFKSIKNAIIKEALKINNVDIIAIENETTNENYPNPEFEANIPDNETAYDSQEVAEEETVYGEAKGGTKSKSWWTKKYMLAKKYLYGNDVEQDIEKAFDLFMAEANRGNPLALYDVGQFHLKGIAVEVDEEKAHDYFAKALNGFLSLKKLDQNSYIQYRIGKMHERGYGTEQDYDEAIKWYKPSVKLENKFAEYSLGGLYYRGNGVEQSYETALELYLASSDKDNAFASYELAKMFHKGVGTESDPGQAQNYYSLAFKGFEKMEEKSGEDTLCYKLGQMLVNGTGTPKDEKRAAYYFEKAAIVGNAYAQYALGKLLLTGKDIERDVQKAITWLSKSADKENDFAQYALGKIFLKGTDQLPANEEKGLAYLKLSADQENSYAQYELGKYCIEKTEIDSALAWLTKSAEQENEFAQYRLGKLYLSGELIPVDTEKALKWLSLSADQGNQFAQYTLGKAYYSGSIGVKDIQKAVRLLEEASNQKNQYAQYMLGKIYWLGEDIKKNMDKAIALLTASAQQGNIYAQKLLQYIQNPYTPKASVISLFYHLSKIIETDRINSGYGKFIHEDSKLMREIMEKKSAQGIRIE